MKLLAEKQRLKQQQALDSKVPVSTRPVDPPPVVPTLARSHEEPAHAEPAHEEPAHEEGFKTPHTNGHRLPGSPHGPLPPQSPTSPGFEDHNDVAASPVGGSVGAGAEAVDEGVGTGQHAGAPNGPTHPGDDVSPTIPAHEDELPRPDLSKDASVETGKVPESRPVATPARSFPPGDSIHASDYTLRSKEDAQVLTLKPDRKHKERPPMPEVTPSDPYYDARTVVDTPSDEVDTQHIL